MDKAKLDLRLLEDTPFLKNDKKFYNFYHSYVSPSLQEILENKTRVNTIGLFGSWGSGKSTIIKNLKEECSREYPVFVFDAWKYQSDPLRRTFLIYLCKFIDKNSLWLKAPPADFLDNLYERESISIAEKISPDKKLGFWKRLLSQIRALLSINPLLTFLFVSSVASILIWTAGQYFLSETHPVIAFFLRLPGILSLSTYGLLALITIFQKTFEIMTEKFFNNMDIDIRTQTTIKTRDFLNSPEQFESKFNDILSHLKKKIVVVFDNIDRVQGDVAISTLASIKTFLEPETDDKIIFIVPCDADSIENQIKGYYKSSTVDPSEYLRKLFNVVVWTPDFIGTDLEDYTKKLIQQMEPNSKLLHKDELILTISHAFKSNPREIKQFLNNLASFLFVASKTEVWDVISENIPYLAKTLILRQKYPDAYKRLKDKWFEPENILADKDPIELRNFMINTSNISTQNAEPFIYLKKPNQAKDVVGSEKLGSLLIAGDIEGAQKIISENIKNKEKVANYILALYSQYKNRPDWMTEIFKSHLVAFDNLGITVDDAAYYNRTLEIADRYLWQSYRVFPTKIFFESIVLNDKASNPPKKNILNRYVSTLSAKEVIEDKKYALELISYLVKTGINFEDTLSAFRRYLEEAYFTETTIIKLFNTHTLQKRFVTKQAFEKFIKLLTFDNLIEWLPVIITFKQFVEENKLGNVCVETLNSIFQTEGIRGNLGDSPQKKTLVESIGNLLNTPYSVASTSESAHVGTLINNVIALYKNSNLSLEEKHYYIVPLLIARISADENIAPQIDSIIDEFIWKVTDIQIIEDNILPTLKTNKLLNDLITRYVGAIQKRAVSLGGEALGSLYQEANTNGQQSVLNAMIAQRSDLGISFIKSLKKVPDRPEAIANLLQRVTALASTDRRGVYEWITSNTKPGDGSEIKNTISTHTSDMLKGDDPSGEETGYDLFKSSINFLSETAQRDIAKSVIEWLRAPERTVSRVNRFSLKGVGLVFNSLQDPLKNDFVFVLFKLLSSSQREDLEVAIEVISEIKPKWPKYQKDFVDFKEKISTWENGDNKKYVISELNKLKSAKPSNKEKSYWKSLNELIPKDNIDKPT